MARTLVPVTTVTPAKATHTTALAGAQNDLVFTAKRGGQWGNALRVRYLDPAANDQSLTIVVEGFDVTVRLATGPAGAITSTANDVLAAVATDRYAGQVLDVALAASNDGTGVVVAFAFTALAGGEFAVTQPAATAADSANDHYLTGNDGTVELAVTNTTGGTVTVTLHYGPLALIGAEQDAEVVSVPNNTTKVLGTFDTARFNQNAAGDVYFDPSVTSASLTFTARKVPKAQG